MWLEKDLEGDVSPSSVVFLSRNQLCDLEQVTAFLLPLSFFCSVKRVNNSPFTASWRVGVLDMKWGRGYRHMSEDSSVAVTFSFLL